jgi:hypothetical protein
MASILIVGGKGRDHGASIALFDHLPSAAAVRRQRWATASSGTA